MRAETALACALLVALAAAGPAAALQSPTDAARGGVTDAAADTRAAADATADSPAVGGSAAAEDNRTVTMEVTLRESGDADWTVTTYVPLDGENETAAFRELGRRFERGTADVAFDAELFRRVATAAGDAAGRQMAVPEDSVNRSWTIRNGTGLLRLRFTWTNFATVEGDRLVVDDAFETRSGTWLPYLEPGQVLVVRPPQGYALVSTPGPAENATLRWSGPRTFADDYFRIVYRADSDDPTPTLTDLPPTPTPTPTGTPTPVTETPGGLQGPLFLGLALLGGGVVAYVLRRRSSVGRGGPPADDMPGPDGAGAAAEGAAADGDDPAEPAPEEADGPFAGVDLEMLSDEERVLRLLDANGGRMKQAQIVRETDWSNAKVSQLLSSMDEAGDIDKLRIGRENLISLPDVDVDDFGE